MTFHVYPQLQEQTLLITPSWLRLSIGANGGDCRLKPHRTLNILGEKIVMRKLFFRIILILVLWNLREEIGF